MSRKRSRTDEIIVDYLTEELLDAEYIDIKVTCEDGETSITTGVAAPVHYFDYGAVNITVVPSIDVISVTIIGGRGMGHWRFDCYKNEKRIDTYSGDELIEAGHLICNDMYCCINISADYVEYSDAARIKLFWANSGDSGCFIGIPICGECAAQVLYCDEYGILELRGELDD